MMKMGRDFNDEDRELGVDASLGEALRNFRANVHAWGEGEFGRPRQARTVRSMSWRVATGWALGCVLAAGSVTGAVYQRQHQREMQKIAAAEQAARQQKLEAEKRASTEDEDLFAKVDSDVSREVPSAMEPLAQLMSESETQ
jgi:uncharacterized protein HemX